MNTLNQPENANTKVSDGWKSLTNHRGTPYLVNWYCSLLTRRTVCGRAARNTPKTQKQTAWNEARNCTNSVLALQATIV